MKPLLYLLPAFIVMLNGCAKDSGANPDNQQDTSLKVKTITENISRPPSDVISNDIFSLKYDNQERLINMKSDNTRIIFEYNNNIIRKTTYRFGNDTSYIDFYFNQVSHLLDSTFLTYKGSIYIKRSIYSYDSENMREKEIVIEKDEYGERSDTGFYTYDQKGNLLSIITSGGIYINYTYSDSANFYNTADMINPDRIKSPNLLIAYSWAANAASHVDSRSNYEFDDHHRISQIIDTVYPKGDMWVQTTSYTYY